MRARPKAQRARAMYVRIGAKRGRVRKCGNVWMSEAAGDSLQERGGSFLLSHVCSDALWQISRDAADAAA